MRYLLFWKATEGQMRLLGRGVKCGRGGREVVSELDFTTTCGEASNAAASLTAVGLDHAAHLPAAYLSAGQRRRLSIARLLAVRRPIWLLDEPASALDTAGQSLFTTLMQDHLAAGGLIIAATHAPLGLAAKELRIGSRAA